MLYLTFFSVITEKHFETLPTKYIQRAIYDFMNASHTFERAKSKINLKTADPLRVRMVNDQMVQIEKAFIFIAKTF